VVPAGIIRIHDPKSSQVFNTLQQDTILAIKFSFCSHAGQRSRDITRRKIIVNGCIPEIFCLNENFSGQVFFFKES